MNKGGRLTALSVSVHKIERALNVDIKALFRRSLITARHLEVMMRPFHMIPNHLPVIVFAKKCLLLVDVPGVALLVAHSTDRSFSLCHIPRRPAPSPSPTPAKPTTATGTSDEGAPSAGIRNSANKGKKGRNQ